MRRSLVCAMLAAAAGCYNPSLGDHPFLCGPPPEPGKPGTCPDGYACDTASNTCTKGSSMASTVDAPIIPHDGGSEADAGHMGVTCDPANAQDKDLEPNDTPAQADQGPSHLGSDILCHPVTGGPCDPFGAYTKFEICRPGDADYISMGLHQGDHIHIDVLFHVIVGDLDAAIINSAGQYVVISAGNGDNESLDFTAPTDGKYYLLVEGFMGQTNTYDLNFTKLSGG
jgi:hypothetical protein